MKSKYSIGFLSCCACLIIAMTFAYQFSYQKAKARAEKLKIEEQQTMENEIHLLSRPAARLPKMTAII